MEVGDKKYLRDGRIVYVLGWHTLSDHVIVTETSGDGVVADVTGVLRMVHEAEVLDAPPVLAYDAEIVRQRARLADLRSSIARLRIRRHRLADEVVELQRRREELLSGRFRQIERFAAGEITHYVMTTDSIYGQPPFILPFALSLPESADGRKGVEWLRMLSLFGKATGDMEWRLNRYQDDSGSWHKVIPCTSWEEALAAQQAEFTRILTIAMEGAIHKANAATLMTWVEKAHDAGAVLPDGFEDTALKMAVDQAKAVVENSVEVLRKQKAVLDAARNARRLFQSAHVTHLRNEEADDAGQTGLD